MNTYDENLENLKRHVQYSESSKNIKLLTPKNIVMFPFKTRTQERPQFKNGFVGVSGEIIRRTIGILDEIENEQILDFLSKLFGEDTKKEHISFLYDFILDGQNGIRTSVKFLSLNPLAQGDQGKFGEKSIAQYIMGTLLANDSQLYSLILDENAENDVLSKISNKFFDSIVIKDIEPEENPQQYYVLDEIIERFKRDLGKLVKNKSMFLNYFDMLLNYYYFYYISSIALMNEYPDQPLKPLFYFVDWEITSKNRQASLEGRRNYHEFSKIADHSYFHINALEHMNILLGKMKYNFKDLNEYIENSSDEPVIFETIKKWLLLFSNAKTIALKIDFDKANNFKVFYDEYLRLLNENDRLNPGVAARFSISFEDAARFHFLKSRGSLGKCLNIKHDFLMLLIYLTVDGRTNLIEMFEKFEDIGVCLDKYTKEEIVKYLSKLDLLIKESDSGVAQYVKTI